MIDRAELKKTWDLFVGEGNFTEIRILGKFAYSGYFRSFDNLCAQLEPYTNMDDEQIYFVLNRPSPDCYARPQCEKFIKSPKSTTKDDEISSRQYLLCDFDPVRLANISSSPEQFELARRRAQEVYVFLKEKGFSDMVVAISGSGWHLLIPVDIPCNEETDAVVKNFYTYMGSLFSDNEVEFDEKVYNRSRITKLYSTVAKKGANIPTNPWRQSKIVYIPPVLTLTPFEAIKALADLAPKEEPKQIPNRGYRQYNSGGQFDLRSWLTRYGIVYKEKQDGGSTKFELEYCPWVDQHSDKKKWDSALFLDGDGKITFNCTHSHCAGRTWFDFRTFYEPGAYDRPVYQPRVVSVPQSSTPQRVILPENSELGKKWLSLKDIEKVNIQDIERVKTGFKKLDDAIKGLFLCEVTIVSGSNSSGKSSWLNTLLANIVQQGYPFALWSGELRADVLKTWIQMVIAGKNYLRRSQYGNFWYVPNDIAEQIDSWLDGRFFLYNNKYTNKWEQIFSDMKELLSIGVRVFVLDNLMSMDIDIFEGDTNKKQKTLVQELCQFAKDNKVHIILVAHPRKSNAFLRKNDISGTANITDAVDNVFIIHRVNADFLRLGKEVYGSMINSYKQYGNVIEVCTGLTLRYIL